MKVIWFTRIRYDRGRHFSGDSGAAVWVDEIRSAELRSRTVRICWRPISTSSRKLNATNLHRNKRFSTILGMEILWSSTLRLAESCIDSSKMFSLVRLIPTEDVAPFSFFLFERATI